MERRDRLDDLICPYSLVKCPPFCPNNVRARDIASKTEQVDPPQLILQETATPGFCIAPKTHNGLVDEN